MRSGARVPLLLSFVLSAIVSGWTIIPIASADDSQLRSLGDAQISALTQRCRRTSGAEREAVLREADAALRSYAKSWQGSAQAQMLFEAAYMELAAEVE